jgi:hypothetical protein
MHIVTVHTQSRWTVHSPLPFNSFIICALPVSSMPDHSNPQETMAVRSDLEQQARGSFHALPSHITSNGTPHYEPDGKPSSKLYRLIHFFGGGIYAPDASVIDPIAILLNTEDSEERDRLTERWKDNRLQELNFVGVVVRQHYMYFHLAILIVLMIVACH